MKRIVLSFDGTWNTPDDDGDEGGNTNTNVRRLHEAVLEKDKQGVLQENWYDEGVGTDWYNRLTGGVAGVGLSKNIRDGYHQLAKLYDPGDEIFVFGFSRGAYTARSLVGLIRNCGVLKEDRSDWVAEAYQIYRTRDNGPESEQAKAFRRLCAYPEIVQIKCLGVWDTVGALGIPVQSFDFFNRHFYQFHDTKLSSSVENAFHALAIDEHRREYEATLWGPSEEPGQRIEQAWFPGAHSNVGGGYKNDILAEVTLNWMVQRAGQCGLALDPTKQPTLADQHWTQDLRDSFAEFVNGFYRFFNSRYYRPIGGTQHGNESFDRAAVERFRRLDYRPSNQIGAHLRVEPGKETLLQQLVGAKAWHALQKLAD